MLIISDKKVTKKQKPHKPSENKGLFVIWYFELNPLTFFYGPPESPLSENNGQRKSLHEIYDGVQTLLIFIGYPRSGHTLVSSLLDAHPHVIVANEFDIIGKWKMWDAANRSKYFLFDQLFMNSKQEADVGYRSATVQHRYTYHVPGQWQGTYNMNILVCVIFQLFSISEEILVFITDTGVCQSRAMYNSTQ